MTEGEQYVLGYREGELERLRRQRAQLEQDSSWLLAQLGPLDGARVLEIGCGPHGCLDQLSRRVGPAGSVVGVDRGPEAVAMAKKMVASEGLTNVEVLERDGRSTGLPASLFDLVTSRLVLTFPTLKRSSPRQSRWPSRVAGSPATRRTGCATSATLPWPPGPLFQICL
jgi:hypothetical protein